MIDDDNDGQMIFGDLGGLKLPDICLTGEEKPRKTSPRKLVPTRDRTQARMLPPGTQRWTSDWHFPRVYFSKFIAKDALQFLLQLTIYYFGIKHFSLGNINLWHNLID